MNELNCSLRDDIKSLNIKLIWATPLSFILLLCLHYFFVQDSDGGNIVLVHIEYWCGLHTFVRVKWFDFGGGIIKFLQNLDLSHFANATGVNDFL